MRGKLVYNHSDVRGQRLIPLICKAVVQSVQVEHLHPAASALLWVLLYVWYRRKTRQ